ncbi:MAG: CPBP family glutamic-type intramembrane protease [Planctomycetota bacterium]
MKEPKGWRDTGARRAAAKRFSPSRSASASWSPWNYVESTRDLSLSWFYLLPLLGLYEWGIRRSGVPLRNAAEVILKDVVGLAGPWSACFHYLFLAGSLVAAADVWRRRLPYLRIYPLFLVECLLWAALLGPLLRWVTGGLALGSLSGSDLLLSLGAGIYEEVVFRLLLVGGGYFILCYALGLGAVSSLAVVVVGSSVLFAAYHHWGPFGEPLENAAFLFRVLAGAVLALLFVFRGLGVAAYMHASYDLLLDLQRSSG